MIEPPIPSRNPLEQLEYMLCKGANITRVSETPVASNDFDSIVVGVKQAEYSVWPWVFIFKGKPLKGIFEPKLGLTFSNKLKLLSKLYL